MSSPRVSIAAPTPGSDDRNRIPQATFLSFSRFVGSLRRADLQRELQCPKGMGPQTWAQLRASLSSLGLMQHDAATILLQRLTAGECSVLEILEIRFGSDVIGAVESGESCSIGSLENMAQLRTPNTIYRFESFVRGALKDQNRSPAKRHQYQTTERSRGLSCPKHTRELSS